MAPAAPKLLTCLERVITVLKDVVASDEYHYTIGDSRVAKGLRAFSEAPSYPFDCVFLGSDHRPIEYLPDYQVMRYPSIVVACYVDEELGEPVTKMLKHLADVQKAIEADLRPGAGAGSLGALINWGHLGSVITDEGELGLEGGAGFRLDIHLCLVGEWGAI
jgi:hypothetical protein